MENNIENKIKKSIESIHIDLQAKERGLNLLNQQYTHSDYKKNNIVVFLKFALIFSLILMTIPISAIVIKEYYKNKESNTAEIINNIAENKIKIPQNTKASPIAFKGVDPTQVTKYVLELSETDIFDTESAYKVIDISLDQMNNLISFKTEEKIYDLDNNLKNRYIGYNYNNPQILSAILEYKTHDYHIKEEIFTNKTRYIRKRENRSQEWSSWVIEETENQNYQRYVPSNIIKITQELEINKEKLDNNYVYTYTQQGKRYKITITPSLTIIGINITDTENIYEIKYSEFNKNYGVLTPKVMMTSINWSNDINHITKNIEKGVTDIDKAKRSYIVEYKNTDIENPEIISGIKQYENNTNLEKSQYYITQKENNKEIRIIGNDIYIFENNKWKKKTDQKGYTYNIYEQLSINEILDFYLNHKDEYIKSDVNISESISIYLKNISYKLQSKSSPLNYYVEITYNQYYEIVAILIHKYNGDEYISSKYINYHNPIEIIKIEIPEEFKQKEEILKLSNNCSEYRNIKNIISKLEFSYSSMFNIHNTKSNISNCEYLLEYNYMTLHIKNTDEITHSNYFFSIKENTYSVLQDFNDGNKLIRTNIKEDENRDYTFSYGTLNNQNEFRYKNINTKQEWVFTGYIPKGKSQKEIDRFIKMTDKVVLSFKEK